MLQITVPVALHVSVLKHAVSVASIILQLIGKTGSVVAIRRDVDICVYFNFCKRTCHFHYEALTKVFTLLQVVWTLNVTCYVDCLSI